MKRILLFISFMLFSLSGPTYATSNKNSVYLAYGGPFFYTYSSSYIYTYGYTRDLSKAYSLGINQSAYPGRPTLTNYSLYYNYLRVPFGKDGIGTNYFIVTIGDIGYDVFDNGVFGYSIGVGSKFISNNIEYFFDVYFLVDIDPAYILSGPRGSYSGGIRYRF